MKKKLKFKIGNITDKGTVMDITKSWKPEIYNQPLYYVTYTPEEYKKGKSCGIWKLGEELNLLSVSGTLLLTELMKRADETNLNGHPVIRDIEDKSGGSTKYVRYDAMVYELNKLLKAN